MSHVKWYGDLRTWAVSNIHVFLKLYFLLTYSTCIQLFHFFVSAVHSLNKESYIRTSHIYETDKTVNMKGCRTDVACMADTLTNREQLRRKGYLLEFDEHAHAQEKLASQRLKPMITETKLTIGRTPVQLNTIYTTNTTQVRVLRANHSIPTIQLQSLLADITNFIRLDLMNALPLLDDVVCICFRFKCDPSTGVAFKCIHDAFWDSSVPRYLCYEWCLAQHKNTT